MLSSYALSLFLILLLQTGTGAAGRSRGEEFGSNHITHQATIVSLVSDNGFLVLEFTIAGLLTWQLRVEGPR